MSHEIGFAYHKANTRIMALLSSFLFNLMLQPKMEFNNDSAVILINFTLHVFYIWILYQTIGGYLKNIRVDVLFHKTHWLKKILEITLISKWAMLSWCMNCNPSPICRKYRWTSCSKGTWSSSNILWKSPPGALKFE